MSSPVNQTFPAVIKNTITLPLNICSVLPFPSNQYKLAFLMSSFGDGFAINMFNFELPLVFIFLLSGYCIFFTKLILSLWNSGSHLEILDFSSHPTMTHLAVLFNLYINVWLRVLLFEYNALYFKSLKSDLLLTLPAVHNFL